MPKSNSGPRTPRPVPASSKSANAQNRRGTRTNNPTSRTSKTNARPRAAKGGQPAARSDRLRNRHPVLFALVPVGLVLAAVVTMVVIKAAGGPSPALAASHVNAAGSAVTNDPATTALSAQVVQDLTVPSATLDAVGSPASVTPPQRVSGGSVLRGADG